MRLVLRRDPAPARRGSGRHPARGIALQFRIDLELAEQDLIDRFELDTQRITTALRTHGRSLETTVADLRAGGTLFAADVDELIEHEQLIKNACDQLSVLFAAARTFGLDEAIQYPRRGHDSAGGLRPTAISLTET